MRKSLFTIDGVWAMFEGYTKGEYHNGRACPYFTKEVAEQIAEIYKMRYNADKDRFETTEPRMFKGVDIDGEHLYPVGHRLWEWNDLADYQNKQEKTLMEYLLEGCDWLNCVQLYDVYYGMCQTINGYMNEDETKAFADGYMTAYDIYVLQKEAQQND